MPASELLVFDQHYHGRPRRRSSLLNFTPAAISAHSIREPVRVAAASKRASFAWERRRFPARANQARLLNAPQCDPIERLT